MADKRIIALNKAAHYRLLAAEAELKGDDRRARFFIHKAEQADTLAQSINRHPSRGRR